MGSSAAGLYAEIASGCRKEGLHKYHSWYHSQIFWYLYALLALALPFSPLQVMAVCYAILYSCAILKCVFYSTYYITCPDCGCGHKDPTSTTGGVNRYVCPCAVCTHIACRYEAIRSHSLRMSLHSSQATYWLTFVPWLCVREVNTLHAITVLNLPKIAGIAKLSYEPWWIFSKQC